MAAAVGLVARVEPHNRSQEDMRRMAGRRVGTVAEVVDPRRDNHMETPTC